MSCASLPTKVNGSAQYAIDVQVTGMIYGAVLRSPVEGGVPEAVDDAAAKAVAGVIDVVRLPYGVGALAKTPWAAFDAKSALESSVTWQRSGKAWGFDSDKGLDAFGADARNLNMATSVDWFQQGDATAVLAKAETLIEAEYRCHYAYHPQMEPLNAVAEVSAAGDSAEVWCGTQYPTAALAAAARALNIRAEKIKLNYTLLGGDFGRRGDYDQEFVVDAVLMAKSAQRPVKVIWTREDDVYNGHFRLFDRSQHTICAPASAPCLHRVGRRRLNHGKRLRSLELQDVESGVVVGEVDHSRGGGRSWYRSPRAMRSRSSSSNGIPRSAGPG
jgi:isoquinoline 1-oxidoreductase subunit beta